MNSNNSSDKLDPGLCLRSVRVLDRLLADWQKMAREAFGAGDPGGDWLENLFITTNWGAFQASQGCAQRGLPLPLRPRPPCGGGAAALSGAFDFGQGGWPPRSTLFAFLVSRGGRMRAQRLS